MSEIIEKLDMLIDAIQHQPRFLSRAQAAEMLNVHPSSLVNFVTRGKRVGSKIIKLKKTKEGFEKSEVLKFRNKMTGPTRE